MEIEQIIKRVDWLDDERRKDKNLLASFSDRLTGVEGNIPPLSQQLKDLGGEITKVTATLGRMDRFDETLLQHRIEVKQNFEELDRQVKKRDEESEKVRRLELRGVEASIVELRKELSPIPELKRAIQARVDETARLEKEINDARVRIETFGHSEEEYTRAYRLLEDGRRQDAKRLTDLQGEVSAVRKHVDDQRGKMELSTTTLKKIETRLNEVSMLEVERRVAQEKFLESQALLQVERERVWKDWQARFEVIERQTADIDTNLQTLDTTHRAVKRSQAALDELTVKVDRRANEMAEIQRLSEERFRQEWVTFKADDQKRWTNYTLTQEEQRGEVSRQYEKLTDRVTQLEDSLQEIQDMLRQMNEQTEKRLQSLLAVVHDWVSAYERSAGRIR
jgi:chromosome segregation ATPase